MLFYVLSIICSLIDWQEAFVRSDEIFLRSPAMRQLLVTCAFEVLQKQHTFIDRKVEFTFVSERSRLKKVTLDQANGQTNRMGFPKVNRLWSS
jgi:hypothetical protein